MNEDENLKIMDWIALGIVLIIILILSLAPTYSGKLFTSQEEFPHVEKWETHKHEIMPYRQIGRIWKDTVCVTYGQYIINNTHRPMPDGLKAIAIETFEGIEFKQLTQE